MKLYMIDCVSSHRITYAIRCKNEEYIKDLVTSEYAREFSQEHLGEQIVRVREISDEEYLELFNKDNDYLASWSDDKKKELISEVIINDNAINKEDI
jgi:hypothetical protein